MYWSKAFIPTLKESPQEAEIPSHQLMLRAGLIRRLAGGLYTFLPLGLRALRHVERIVREEMNAAGALEVLMPALQPREIWERSGRIDTLSDVMFSISDRQDRGLVLGPTHEEIITDLAAREISSYRQLPKNFYQIQTKFRDEIRPRFGLMRAKEFIMKDAYSFDADDAGAERSYRAMYAAYERIFARYGLRVKVVEADTGAMGGQSSHEFMVLADAGEDGIVECGACPYAANLEKATAQESPPLCFETDAQDPEPVDTPRARTIAEVADCLKAPPGQLIKTLIYRVGEDTVAVLLPGDREVNEVKLAHLFEGQAVEPADEETVQKATGAPVGFAGPVGLDLPIYADRRLQDAVGMISGANQADRHLLHIDMKRDVKALSYTDLSMAREGDRCPHCGGDLYEKRGIEVGHVFKLGTKYSETLRACFLDAEGSEQPAIMGCYGIGVTRTLQALIEQSHDKNGIIWPVGAAPYPVEILMIDPSHEPSVQAAQALADTLIAAGEEPLIDDREERPGVKFKDADLLGLPLRVTIGDRGLSRGALEIRERASGEDHDVPPEDAADWILEYIQRARSI